MLRLKVRQNCLTVPKAIRELEKIEMVRRDNGLYRLDHAVTKKQKVILSSVGMSEDDIFKTAAEIAELLKKNKSLLPEPDEDDGGDVDFAGEDEVDFFD